MGDPPHGLDLDADMLFWRNEQSCLVIHCLCEFQAIHFQFEVENKHEPTSPTEKEEILRICNQMFGAPVDEKQNLFEIDQFHVLRVKFTNRGRLEQLAVEPKYYFEESHPDWKEPNNFANLTKSEYENLLARLESVKPKGLRWASPRN